MFAWTWFSGDMYSSLIHHKMHSSKKKTKKNGAVAAEVKRSAWGARHTMQSFGLGCTEPQRYRFYSPR